MKICEQGGGGGLLKRLLGENRRMLVLLDGRNMARLVSILILFDNRLVTLDAITTTKQSIFILVEHLLAFVAGNPTRC